MAEDRVCGMEVDPSTAQHTSEYEEESYYFYAPGGKRAFEGERQQYMEREE